MAAPAPALSLVQRYELALETSPLRTQMIATGILFGAGDLLMQLIDKARGNSEEGYSLVRTVRMTVHGAVVNTTLYHVFMSALKCAAISPHPAPPRLLAEAPGVAPARLPARPAPPQPDRVFVLAARARFGSYPCRRRCARCSWAKAGRRR